MNTTVELWVPTAGGENRRPVLDNRRNFVAQPKKHQDFCPLPSSARHRQQPRHGGLPTGVGTPSSKALLKIPCAFVCLQRPRRQDDKPMGWSLAGYHNGEAEERRRLALELER